MLAVRCCFCKTTITSLTFLSKKNRLFSTASPHSSQNRAVAYWLLGMSGLVAGMVTVGGITRLTRSGLSMTDWKLQGSLPPINASEWEEEFARYKKYPEWQQRQKMTIDEFKFIYFWEYGHRMMGRFLGIAFIVPLSVFAYKGMIPRNLYVRLGILFSLGGTQGLVGWWMVKSGLTVEASSSSSHFNKEIRVSPYRLATHLGMAFTTYTLLLWTALDLLHPRGNLEAVAKALPSDFIIPLRRVRGAATGCFALVAATAISGAYVAGNDAGRAYGTFPTMNGDWVPEGILALQPWWRNFFENTATVQFDHRLLALSSLTAVTGLFVHCRGAMLGTGQRSLWSVLPRMTRVGLRSAVGMAWVQVCLGITTLLLVVPVPLAALHQAGSLVLLSCVTYLCHSLRFASYLPTSIAGNRVTALLFATVLTPKIFKRLM